MVCWGHVRLESGFTKVIIQTPLIVRIYLWSLLLKQPVHNGIIVEEVVHLAAVVKYCGSGV